jgi:hypothetical protein
MAQQNFNISAKRGRLYLKSKEPKEGYETVSYGDGKTTFHKYQDRVEGIITKVETKDVEAGGKKLQFFEVTLKDGDTYNNISTPLKNSKGNFTDEVKAFVSSLNNCPPFARVSVSCYNKTTESGGKTYDNLNIFINLLDEVDPETGKPKGTGFIPYTEVPRAIKEDDPDLGVTWDWKPVNKYYIGKIKEIISKFEAARAATPTAPPPSNTVGVAAGKVNNNGADILADIGDDDLPF